MEPLAALSSLGLFGTGLSQHARLFTLASAQDRALPESLMAEKFSGHGFSILSRRTDKKIRAWCTDNMPRPSA